VIFFFSRSVNSVIPLQIPHRCKQDIPDKTHQEQYETRYEKLNLQGSENFCFEATWTDLVDAKPFGNTFRMVSMFAQQFYLLIPSFIFHLANYTSVSQQ